MIAIKSLIKHSCKYYIAILLVIVVYAVWESSVSQRIMSRQMDSRNISNSLPTSETFIVTNDLKSSEWIPDKDKTVYFRYDKYKYVFNSKDVCDVDRGNSLFLLIVVKSSVHNAENREGIRETWGSFHDSRIKIVFLLGYNPLLEDAVKLEYNTHKDIVQFSFLDNYYNNTLKTNMAFDWVFNHCPLIKFVMFVDDDYFVNIPNLMEYLHFHEKNNTSKLAAGSDKVHDPPIRDKRSKWYMPAEVYPYKEYPTYLSGGSFVYDISVVKAMYSEIPSVKPFKYDDVFLGMVANSLRLEFRNERRFSTVYQPKQMHVLFSAHGFSPKEHMLSEWVRINCEHTKLFIVIYDEPKCNTTHIYLNETMT